MLPSILFLCVYLTQIVTSSSITKSPQPEYQKLPPLKEQAALQNAWTQGRISNIPSILQKYGLDAWLMSQKEYTEDVVFWSLKSAQQFSARRRTVQLFLANATKPTKSSYTWIDNTPTVWDELLDVLEEYDPKKIAVNADQEVAFGAGLHVGELANIVTKLGKKWRDRLVSEPMLGVEYIATMPEGQLSWYKRLQETAWRIISDGFSKLVITPGETTTEVCSLY